MPRKPSPCILAVSAVLALLSVAAGASGAEAPVEPSGSAWMGVWLEDAVDGGVEIVAVVPGGPAALARLRPGDIILRANRKQIPIQDALRSVLLRLKPGDPLELQLLRSGRSVDAQVKLVARAPRATPPLPASPPTAAAPHSPRLPFMVATGGLNRVGLRVADVTPALRSFYGAPEDSGVLVTRAEPQKLAGRAGIRVGDILVQLGERKLASENQVATTLARWNPTQPLSAVVVRDGESKTVTLVAHAGIRAEVTDSSEQRKRERDVLARRLQSELDRLELRIAEIRRELEDLRHERQ